MDIWETPSEPLEVSVKMDDIRTGASQAISLASPMVKMMMDGDVIKRQHLHIIAATFTPNPDGEYTFCTERSFGDPSRWEHNYVKIAQAKTRISARTGLTSREVQFMHPDLLLRGDVMYWGNAVRGNRIVSCSGVQPWFDEAIANAILGIWCALTQDEVEKLKKESEEAGIDYYDS